MINKNHSKIIFFISILFLFVQCQNNSANLQFISKLPKNIKRSWINENFWANRLQDWQLNNGRIECINGERPLRTVHLLPYVISKDSGNLHLELEFGTISQNESLETGDFAGLLLGAGSVDDDFKKRAIIHGAYGKNAGIVAGVNGKGKIIFLDNENEGKILNFAAAEEIKLPNLNKKGLLIHIDIKPSGNFYTINLSIVNKKTDEILSYAKVSNIEKHKIEGNIALIANGACDENKASFWFENLRIEGNKLKYEKENTLGPIVGTIFTNFEKDFRLTAQFMPLAKNDSKDVSLEISEYQKEDWKLLEKTKIDTSSYTAKFNVKIENTDVINEFKLVYKITDSRGKTQLVEYKGIIPNNKNRQNIIKLATLKETSFNDKLFSNNTFDFSSDELVFSKGKLINDLKKQRTDLLLFLGEQVSPNSFEKADFSSFQNLKLNYLYKWYLWYWSYGDLTKTRSSVLMPNNFDFFVENPHNEKFDVLKQKLKSKKAANDFIQLVNNTQCSNKVLCKEDNNQINNVSFKYGNVDFALLLNPHKKEEIEKENILVQNSTLVTEVDTFLLEQLDFIKKWSLDWGKSEIKAIITQNPIINITKLDILANRTMPKANNNLVLLSKKIFSVIISGAEEQSAFLRHGINTFSDASYNFISPNLRNSKEFESVNLDFYSKNNDKIKLLAKEKETTNEDKKQTSFSYGLVKFNKFQKTINFENRRLIIDNQENIPQKEINSKPWSQTIVINNIYSEKTPSYLPLLKIKGINGHHMVYIYGSKTRELIYAKRIKKMSFKPKVYYWGRFDIEIVDSRTGKKRIFKSVLSKNILDTSELIVNF